MNAIFHVVKRSNAVTVRLNKSLSRSWRAYISYVMLTIVMRVQVNKVFSISPYFSKCDCPCYEMILFFRRLWFISL
jgi:hypothetical protein